MKKIKQIIIKFFWIKIFNFLLKVYKNIKFIKSLFKYYINKIKLWKYHTFKNFHEISIKDRNVFFWYYEKQPFSKDWKNILFISTHKDLSNYKNWEKADLMIYDLENKEFKKIWETNTWNTQMWCRLHWFNEDKNQIIYNDLVDWNYWTIIKDIKENKIIKKTSLAMYDISKDKNYILSLDFSRLETLRKGYWYSNIKDNTIWQNIPKNNWIWLYNLNTDKKELIINLEDIVKLDYLENMKDSIHYINHISCNKYDNDSFIFFHLWQNQNWRYSRTIYYNSNSKELKVINKWLFVSHYDWKNENELLIYSQENNKKRFHLYNIKTWKINIIWNDLLKEDWHQTYFKDKNNILLDTYPNKKCFQELFIYDSLKNKKIDIWKILHYPQLDDTYRTDLHPRLSIDEKFFCIDSNPNWLRKMIILKNKTLKKWNY